MARSNKPGATPPSTASRRLTGEQRPGRLVLVDDEYDRQNLRLDLILKLVGLGLALAAIGISAFADRDRLFLLAGPAIIAILLRLERSTRRLRQLTLRVLGGLARRASAISERRAESVVGQVTALLWGSDSRREASSFGEPSIRRGKFAALRDGASATLCDVRLSQIVVLVFGVGYFCFAPQGEHGSPNGRSTPPPSVARFRVDRTAFERHQVDAEPIVAPVVPIRRAGVPVHPAAAPRAAEGVKPGAAKRAESPCGGRFTILQLNDVYRVEGLARGTLGGLARVRTIRKELEAGGAPVLVLHAGDMLSPSVMSKYLHAGPMIRCLNLLDGDPVKFDPYLIATFGNHEFDDDDPLTFLGRVAQSDFRWVSSNVAYCTTPGAPAQWLSERLRNVHETICLNIGGVRVGVFGLTLDYQQPGYVSYVYHDLGARHRAAREAIDRLRADGARMIIALTHQELTEDIKLARAFPGEIDLIVGGHEHFSIQRRVGATLITKADADARTVIVHDVQVGADGHAAVIPTPRVLDEKIQPDGPFNVEVTNGQNALAKQFEKHTRLKLTDHLGDAGDVALDGYESTVRGRESALGNFLADTIREEMRVDVAFINGGSIRLNDVIPARQPITRLDLEGIFYYDNPLVAFKLSGEQILAILKNAVSKVHLGDGRFLHFSGLTFRYHIDGTDDEPKYRIDPKEVNVFRRDIGRFEPINARHEYEVATIEYVWKKGYSDGFEVFSKDRGGSSPEVCCTRESFRQVVETRLKTLKRSGSPVSSTLENRIAPLKP